jgi:uncharacterized protein with HEPN domain
MLQMLDYAKKARAMVVGRRREDLDRDDTLQLALTRAVEVIGEAAWRVSESARNRHAEIPWRDIVGMRNRLIHGYDAVDLNLLWTCRHGRQTFPQKMHPKRHLQCCIGSLSLCVYQDQKGASKVDFGAVVEEFQELSLEDQDLGMSASIAAKRRTENGCRKIGSGRILNN